MTVADAIRLGSLLKPQGFGHHRDRMTTSCAMDAAVEAVGQPNAICTEVFPQLRQVKANCPECGAVGYTDTVYPVKPSFAGVIAHLNDHHLWTRERIADWVESIMEPPALTTAPVKEEELVTV